MIAMLRARMKLFPILFADIGVRQSYAWNAEDSGGLYVSQFEWISQLEVGWEFN